MFEIHQWLNVCLFWRYKSLYYNGAHKSWLLHQATHKVYLTKLTIRTLNKKNVFKLKIYEFCSEKWFFINFNFYLHKLFLHEIIKIRLILVLYKIFFS